MAAFNNLSLMEYFATAKRKNLLNSISSCKQMNYNQNMFLLVSVFPHPVTLALVPAVKSVIDVCRQAGLTYALILTVVFNSKSEISW